MKGEQRCCLVHVEALFPCPQNGLNHKILYLDITANTYLFLDWASREPVAIKAAACEVLRIPLLPIIEGNHARGVPTGQAGEGHKRTCLNKPIAG